MLRKLGLSVVLAFISISISAQPGIYSESDVELQNKFMEAQVFKYLGETEKQIESLKELLKLDQQCHAAMYELSKAYATLENTELAINYAAKAYKDDQNEWYALNLADAYESEQYYNKSEEIFAQLVAQETENKFFYHRLAFSQQIQGKGLEAIATFDKLEQVEGVTENTSKRKFEIYSNLNKEKEAANELEKLSSHFPNNIRFLNNLASYYNRIGETKKANQTYRKVLDIDPTDSTANMALIQGDFEQAKDDQYLHAIKPLIENSAIPLDAKIKELIPYVMEMSNDANDPTNQAIISNVDRLLNIYPEESKVHALNGDVYYKLGNNEKALKSYQKAISLNNNIFPIWKNLLSILYEQKQFEVMENYGEELIDLFPNNFDSYFFKGIALIENDKMEDFEDLLFEAGFVAGKDNTNILKLNALKSLERLQQNKPKEALDFISKLNTEEALLPYTFEIFGDVYAANNKMKDALSYWQKAYLAGNASPILQQKINQKKFIE